MIGSTWQAKDIAIKAKHFFLSQQWFATTLAKAWVEEV
jgi:hypothetical protein